MKKELKSCTGALLRADLTGITNSANQPISAKKGGMITTLFHKFSIPKFGNYDRFPNTAGYLIFSFTYHVTPVFSFWSDYYSSVQPSIP